jgi:hypothetical protein
VLAECFLAYGNLPARNAKLRILAPEQGDKAQRHLPARWVR